MTLWWELMCHQGGGSLGAAPQGLQPIWCQLSPRSWPLSWLPHFLQGPHPHRAPRPSARHLLLPALCSTRHQALFPQNPGTRQGLGAIAGRGKETPSPCILFPLPLLLSPCPKAIGRETHRRCPRGRHRIHADQHIQVGDHRRPQLTQGHQLTLSASQGLGDVRSASRTRSRVSLPASLRPPIVPLHR